MYTSSKQIRELDEKIRKQQQKVKTPKKAAPRKNEQRKNHRQK